MGLSKHALVELVEVRYLAGMLQWVLAVCALAPLLLNNPKIPFLIFFLGPLVFVTLQLVYDAVYLLLRWRQSPWIRKR